MVRLFMGAGAVLLLAGACAYVLPASWRAYRVDPDDAAPAITRALDNRSITIADWNQAEHRIVTEWSMSRSGVDQARERYIVSWERNEDDGTLTVYVRHEVQDREMVDGRPSWSTTYHESEKEGRLLDAISKALEESRAPMGTPNASGEPS